MALLLLKILYIYYRKNQSYLYGTHVKLIEISEIIHMINILLVCYVIMPTGNTELDKLNKAEKEHSDACVLFHSGKMTEEEFKKRGEKYGKAHRAWMNSQK